MEVENIVLTLIYSRYMFDNLCKGIDEVVLKFATRQQSPTINTFNIITKKIEEKIALCNAKVIIDEAINSIKGTNRLIAIDKYIHNICISDVTKKYGYKTVNNVIERYQRIRLKIIDFIKKKYSKCELICIIKDSPFLITLIKDVENCQHRKNIYGLFT